MFGLSRRHMKLGRVKKVQLSESAQGLKSPLRPTKRVHNPNSESMARSDELDSLSPSAAPPEISNCTSENWMVLSVAGDKPAPRFNHAAAVIGNKMVLVSGESENGLLDDVQVLSFENFAWSTVSSKLYWSPSSLPLKIPSWKGHCLVSWGRKVLLVGGKTEPSSDRVSVWAFDMETECWSLLEAKGDIPVARSGHTVVRASSVLILFGGEDARKRKLNDLHMFDLKTSTWLPLSSTGTRPCPRSNHVAALVDDKILFVFGGASKSRTLNDLYSLDFETMVWSRIKIRGFHPSPRAGCCGVLCGTKWYITGGGSRKKRHAETLIFDILKVEWSVASLSPPSSITTNKGFSLVLVHHKGKDFLVAFGGIKKEPSNQVEVLIVDKNETSVARSGKRSGLASELNKVSSQCSIDLAARQNLASAIEHHASGRKSLSDLTHVDPNPGSGNVSLRKQLNEDEYNAVFKVANTSSEETYAPAETELKGSEFDTVGIRGGKNNIEETCPAFEYDSTNLPTEKLAADKEELMFQQTAPSNVYQFYEAKMTALIRKNGILEGQLAAAFAGREATEKNLSCATKSKLETEKKLLDTIKEVEILKEKLSSVELAQEEANSMSNIVHSDNVRLEHDVAFLKAVLDDTQKELHSTRGVLAGERARAFQLQVEVFHLKQRLQSMENRAPTPRKPFHV